MYPHHWCALREFCKSGEIDPPLLDLNSLPLAFVLVVLVRALALICRPGPGAFSSKVARTFIDEATVCVAWTIGLYIL